MVEMLRLIKALEVHGHLGELLGFDIQLGQVLDKLDALRWADRQAGLSGLSVCDFQGHKSVQEKETELQAAS